MLLSACVFPFFPLPPSYLCLLPLPPFTSNVVALHETTDVEACSLSICSSLELLVQSLTHLQLEQDCVQHTLSLLTLDRAVEGRTATAAEKVLERLMDGREEVMERVVQMLQVMCNLRQQ